MSRNAELRTFISCSIAVVFLLNESVLSLVVAEEAKGKSGIPRLFVADFNASNDRDDSSWVAYAVSECLRERLRRARVTTVVSEMRTASVMSRLGHGSTSLQEQIVRNARFLGADYAVIGEVSKNEKGYGIRVSLISTQTGDNAMTQSSQAPAVRLLIDATTDIVLGLLKVNPDDAERRRLLGIPHGSDSAIEYYAKAVRALRAGKPSDSLHYVSESVRYDNTFCPTMKLLAQMNIAAGNDREAQSIYERLLRQAKLNGDPVDEAFAMMQMGMSCQRRGEPSTAEKYYQAALEQSRKAGLADQEAMVIGAMASLRVDQRRKDDALELLGRRLKLLEAQGDRLALGPACMTVALVLSAMGDTKQAIQFLNRAAELADDVEMPSDKSVALYQMGELYRESGELDEALKAYHASLTLSDEAEAGSACRQIAEIYEKQGKVNESLEMLRRAASILSKRKAYAQQANCLARIARLQLKQAESAKALETMTEAVEILRDLRHPDLAAYEKELAEMKARGKTK